MPPISSPSLKVGTVGTRQQPDWLVAQKPTNYAQIFVGLAAGALIIGLSVIGFRDSDHGDAQPKDFAARTSLVNTSIEQKLAVIDGVQFDTVKVNRYRSLLMQLVRTYPENQQQIGDMTAKIWQTLGDEGVSESLVNMLEGMNRVSSSGTRTRTYASTLALYATYRTRGLSHNQAVDSIVELVRAGLF